MSYDTMALLAGLFGEPAAPTGDPAPVSNLQEVQPSAPEPEPLFPPDLLAALGTATVRWAGETSGTDADTAAERDAIAHEDDAPAESAVWRPEAQADDDDHDLQPSFRRLIGCGFPGRQTETPPASILADPVVMCPRCGVTRMLAELRGMTGGLCWPCWAAERVAWRATR